MKVQIDEYLTAGEKQKGGKQASSILQGLSESELLSLRAEIQNMLPARRLQDINLEQELVYQLRTAQLLQEAVMSTDDLEIPANQKAQVLNSVAATIQHLIKMQSDLYTFERFKRIESMLVRLLNTWPDEQTREFFTRYEKELKKLGE